MSVARIYVEDDIAAGSRGWLDHLRVQAATRHVEPRRDRHAADDK
jgi:hypothetical protein